MVVRPDAGDPNMFTIVGISDIDVTYELYGQKTTYEVPENERFVVNSGDMIAVGISGTNPALQISNNSQETSHRWTFFDSSTWKSGDVITTRYVSIGREVSIAANIRAPGNCFAMLK